MSVKDPVRHCLDLDHEKESLWGIRSLIPRWLPILTTIAAKVILGLLSLYHHLPLIGVALLVSSAWALVVIWLVRRHRMAWMLSDEELHRLTHRIRDRLDEILSCEDRKDKEKLRLLVERFEEEFANAVAGYFANRIHNRSCGCCFRLAGVFEGKEAYLTRARSASLGVGREADSEPVFDDSPFVTKLKAANCRGVFLLNDLEAATATSAWPDMKNNGLHHFDSVMYAPVNTFFDEKKRLSGMLFVTAKGRAFQPAHTTAVKVFADLLAAFLPLLYDDVPASPVTSDAQKTAGGHSME